MRTPGKRQKKLVSIFFVLLLSAGIWSCQTEVSEPSFLPEGKTSSQIEAASSETDELQKDASGHSFSNGDVPSSEVERSSSSFSSSSVLVSASGHTENKTDSTGNSGSRSPSVGSRRESSGENASGSVSSLVFSSGGKENKESSAGSSFSSPSSSSATGGSSVPTVSSRPQEVSSNTSSGPKEQLCSLTIDCSAALEHKELLSPEKQALLPNNGILYFSSGISVSEGDSVFSLLQRVTRENGIHMDFAETLVYNSRYVRGIGNLYEKDCGQRSGWVYLVNGKSPSVGCNQYILKGGETIQWKYVCG